MGETVWQHSSVTSSTQTSHTCTDMLCLNSSGTCDETNIYLRGQTQNASTPAHMCSDGQRFEPCGQRHTLPM